MLKNKYKWIVSIISFNIILQPIVTFLLIFYLINSFDIKKYMAYISHHNSGLINRCRRVRIRKKYNYFSEEVSISLVIALFALSYLLAI